jgi:hypothetical protein
MSTINGSEPWSPGVTSATRRRSAIDQASRRGSTTSKMIFKQPEACGKYSCERFARSRWGAAGGAGGPGTARCDLARGSVGASSIDREIGTSRGEACQRDAVPRGKASQP